MNHFWAPLRRELRGRPAETFRASVDTKVSVLGIMLPVNGRLQLVVRGDAFEVSLRRRKMDREIWDALIEAGAQPIGPGPSGAPS
jgi:hypothetical protein